MMPPPKKSIFLFVFLIIILLNSQDILSEENIIQETVNEIAEEIIEENNIDENTKTEVNEEEIAEVTETQEDIIDNNDENIATDTKVSEELETETTEELEAFYVDIDNIDEALENIETDINKTEDINDSVEINETESINDSIDYNETETPEENETVDPTETIVEEPEVVIDGVEEIEVIEEIIEEELKDELVLKIDKQEYKAGETVTIYVDAPKDSDINLLVSNDRNEYAYFYTDEAYPSTFKFPLTDLVGKYIVKAIMYISEKKEIKEVTFDVIPNENKEQNLEVSIDALNKVNVGELINFNAVVWNANSPEYDWYFEDDVSIAKTKSTVHIFDSAGIFKVKLTVTDNEATAEDTLLVHVNPNKNKFIINVQGPQARNMPSAKVTVGDEVIYTNNLGKAEFMLPKGTYNLKIEKQGYITYKSKEEIKNYKLAVIKLENNINIANKLSSLTNKNQIREITVLDKNGNIIESVDHEDKILDMLLKVNKKNTVISIKDFKGSDANWDKIENIEVSTEDSKIETAVDKQGFIPKEIVSIQNLDEFILENDYYGIVTFDISNIEYNSVLYCDDDYECSKINKCITGIGKESCYSIKDTTLMVYVPHFSSIILALDNKTAELEITSPNEIIDSGENVYLNFTVNESVIAKYSLDNNELTTLNNGDYGTEFSVLLEGTLERSILSNGIHNIIIEIIDEHNNSNSTLYTFTVNDTFPPIIELSHNGIDLNNKIINSENQTQEFIIYSNEYALITYRLNSDDLVNVELREDNSKLFYATLQNGANNITINATDMHGNNVLLQYVFYFTHNTHSCSDGIQNGDEIGVDCGGSCATCIDFNVTTDKTTYNNTDNVKVTLVSRADSEVNLTVLLDGDIVYNEYITSYSPGYPIYVITTIENTDTPGNYTINATMYYLHLTESIKHDFEITTIEQSNPLEVTINPNSTEIKAGETITFNATVTGNTDNINYNWDFENDKTIDSTSSTPKHTYNTKGTYTVDLTVNDGSWTKSAIKTITVKKWYNVSVTVKNNGTDAIIENAEVELHNQIKNTSSSGESTFRIEAGEYSLSVSKSEFVSNTRTIKVDANKKITVTLKERDKQPPVIEIISPKNNDVINSNSVTLRYKVYDDTKMTCKILINTFDDWWNLEKTHFNIESSSEQSYLFDNLENKEYKWKVECEDRQSNRGRSSIITFTINIDGVSNQNEESELSEEDSTIQDTINKIDEAITSIDTLDSSEKEAASLIDLRKLLEKSKTNINRADRDLDNLKWRKLDEAGEQEAKEEINNRIEDIKKTTPKNIKVIENNEFVKYPTSFDIENITLEILNFDNIRLKDKEKKGVLKKNKELQSSATITTKYKVLDVEYISGDKGTITLIQKEVSIKEDNSNFNLVELIPKSIAADSDDLNLLFQTEVINPDPILRIDLEKTDNIVYYVKKRVSALDIQDTKSVVFLKEVSGDDMVKITGFASLKNIGSKFIGITNKKLTIEIAIIVILLIVYLTYSLDGLKKMKYLFKSKEEAQKLKEIKNFIDEAFKNLKENKYENAKRIYSEINSKFKELPANLKKSVYKKIIKLCNKIDFSYINKLTNDAFNYLDNNQSQKAIPIYESVKNLYKKLAQDDKAIVIARCNQLYKKLNGVK